MFNQSEIQRVEIDKENKKLCVYYKEYPDTTLLTYPAKVVEPNYYREIYSFDNLEFVEKEYATVERGYEKINYIK